MEAFAIGLKWRGQQLVVLQLTNHHSFALNILASCSAYRRVSCSIGNLDFLQKEEVSSFDLSYSGCHEHECFKSRLHANH